MEDKAVIVIGHKNPDTDSICSAIAYANLKRIITGKPYEAKEAGHLNLETRYVLDRFGVAEPELMVSVEPTMRDVDITPTDGISADRSLKSAWNQMKENNHVTLPILKDSQLEGLISIGDIAQSYMEEQDSFCLSKANTPYCNIIETLDGTMVVGDENAYFDQGEVLIAAANPDVMEQYIHEHDMVILGNRYESQLCAIEMKAGCIVVCLGSPVSMTIQKMAKEAGCTIIITPYDTFKVARLINQSIPVRFLMRQGQLVTFSLEDYVKDARDIMAKKRHRNFPVLDAQGRYVGMIGRRNLLDMKPKQVIMVDHNEKSQAVDGINSAEVLEIIDHHRLGSIETMNPVYFRNQPLGCTATIIYQMYQENGVEIEPKIAALLCSAILSDTLMFRSPTCTALDEQVAREMARIAGVEVEELAEKMFSAGSDLSSKSDEEIYYLDYKKFTLQELTVSVGQISSMNQDELDTLKARLIPFMQKRYQNKNNRIPLFMLTNIGKQTTDLIFVGNHAAELLAGAFNVTPGENSVILPGVVSRKKQMVPSVLTAIQKMNE